MSGLVFFSGGTALRETAREAARRGLHTTHIITTFDSGGSSRELRLAFNMPAVGDLRNRLIALANPSRREAATFLNRRLPKDKAAPCQAMALLLKASLPSDQYNSIQLDLDAFLAAVPPDFDARGASIGNLAITGAYLRLDRNLTLATGRYAKILQIRGSVLPVTEASLHLCATLASGGITVGQHCFKNLSAPVQNLALCDVCGRPCEAEAQEEVKNAIHSADIVCLPMGSFYSSILANLLPKGVASALLGSSAKKIFIPNTGADPELFDLDLSGQAKLIGSFMKGEGGLQNGSGLPDFMLVDPLNGVYPGGYGANVRQALQNMGIPVLEARIVSGGDRHDPVALMDILQKLY